MSLTSVWHSPERNRTNISVRTCKLSCFLQTFQLGCQLAGYVVFSVGTHRRNNSKVGHGAKLFLKKEKNL